MCTRVEKNLKYSYYHKLMLVTNLYKTITIEKLSHITNPIFIDLRSPGEYQTGHILNAMNIPIFDDDERAEVGYTYKNIGVDAAKDLGLSIASKKLPDIVKKIRSLYTNKHTLILYCWRGGMRSRSIVSILELMGIPSFQLVGGYKGYRRHILDALEAFTVKPQIVLLCGSTGVGKSALLHSLANHNIPVIDLEQLANHRGSSFGQVGMGIPETAQNFDAKILEQLQMYNNSPYIVVECESKRIGNVYLPDCLYTKMKTGLKILLYADMEVRISRLIEEYTNNMHNRNMEELLTSLASLGKRLGKKVITQLTTDLKEGRLRNVVKVLLVDYYDPLYGYERANQSGFNLTINCDNLDYALKTVIAFLHELVNKQEVANGNDR